MNSGGCVIISLLVLGSWLSANALPFQCQEQEVARICQDLIRESAANLPGFVRLAFHDCVGAGGCDGCVDLGNGDNGGLQVYMDSLDEKYEEHKIREKMSRADFWVLCSHVALKEGQINSGKAADADSLSLNMVYGRTDCNEDNSNQVSASDAYPVPHGNYTATTSYFATEFGLTANETIALLGAHTLGRARPSASGFQNQWVDDEFSFDNAFYVDILNKKLNWTLVDLNGDDDATTSHYQWSQNIRGNSKNLMFTSDMCLAYDVQANSTGFVNETLDEIPESPGYGLVNIYAQDNAQWLSDFSVAYRKMVKKVEDGSDITLLLAKPDGNSPVCASASRQFDATTSSAVILKSALIMLLLSLLISIHGIFH